MKGDMVKKRLISVIYLLVFLGILSVGIGKMWGKGREAKASFFAMDTYISLTLYGKDGEKAVLEAQEKMTELEGLWSATHKESIVYALNHSGGAPVILDDETKELLRFAVSMARETEGALEPTIYPVLLSWGFTTGENRIPDREEIQDLLKYVGYDNIRIHGKEALLPSGTQLDFGAVAKGYAGDMLVELLRERGITSGLLDLGGNIQAIGSKPDGSSWRIGLRDPFGDGYLGVIEASDLAVVTSGNYERFFVGEDGNVYGHIIDPVTGCPADSGLASVTVIAKEGKVCDALSTALFVMGLEKASGYWREHRDFDMILITEDGKIYLTEGAKSRFSLNNSYEEYKWELIGER